MPAIMIDSEGKPIDPDRLERYLTRHYQKADIHHSQPTPDDVAALVRVTFVNLLNEAEGFAAPFDHPISLDELYEALLATKNDKAPVSDEVQADLLKCLDSASLPTLLQIFNACRTQAVIPEAWLEGIILPILKAGREADLRVLGFPKNSLSGLGF